MRHHPLKGCAHGDVALLQSDDEKMLDDAHDVLVAVGTDMFENIESMLNKISFCS
mgnify:CR=1 FL=1